MKRNVMRMKKEKKNQIQHQMSPIRNSMKKTKIELNLMIKIIDRMICQIYHLIIL